jgi:hypothetical protein
MESVAVRSRHRQRQQRREDRLTIEQRGAVLSRAPLLCAVYVFFGFLGPRGFDVGRLTTPFRKCVSSKRSKKTNNPNPSPIRKIWFGLFLSGAGNRNRTCTVARKILNLVRLPIPPYLHCHAIISHKTDVFK